MEFLLTYNFDKYLYLHKTEPTALKEFITPRNLINAILNNVDTDRLKEFYTIFNNFLYQYRNGVDIASDIILPEKKLITPSKEIIKDVTILNETLLKKAKENPYIIHEFTPRQFEEMVCELLDKQGYDVKLTKQTRDGGKDIIAVQKSILGEFVIYVDCKKYAVHNPIRVGLVRELYGTVAADDVTAGLLVTTSYFTKDAKEYRDTIKNRMSLMDYNDLVQALNRINI